MPRYEFRCRECLTTFELSRPMTAYLWFLVRLYVGYDFITAGWHKLNTPAWVDGSGSDSELLVWYGARLNDFLHSTRIRAMCLYEWRRSRPGVLRDVLRTHPLAIIDRRLHNNPYYEPADIVLGNGDEEGLRFRH